MRATTDNDVAVPNGGRIRGDKRYSASTSLAHKDVLTEMPFGNKTAKLSLTGAQLLEALETGVSQVYETKGRFHPSLRPTLHLWLSKANRIKSRRCNGRRRRSRKGKNLYAGNQ